jgi:hypothetical protein
MGWFFRKKKIPQEKKEVQVLEQVEEKIEKKEIKLCEDAIRAFTEAGHQCYFTSSTSRERGWVAFNSPQHNKKFVAHVDETQQHLLNIRTYANKMVKLAERLEKDLLDIRDGTHEKNVDYLSNSESRVLSFAKDIRKHVQQLVAQLKQLSQHDLIEVRNTGYMDPKDTALGKRIREEMVAIQRGLNGLHKMLLDLFELEKKVEELTVAYINT